MLSLETGYERDYAEGAAYRDYFGTDRLMFEVPAADSRLKNKAEVLVLRPDVHREGRITRRDIRRSAATRSGLRIRGWRARFSCHHFEGRRQCGVRARLAYLSDPRR